MAPEDDPSNQPFPETLDDAWMDIFGHPYTLCKDLSKLGGEIGELHRGHIKYYINATEQLRVIFQKSDVSDSMPLRGTLFEYL